MHHNVILSEVPKPKLMLIVFGRDSRSEVYAPACICWTSCRSVVRGVVVMYRKEQSLVDRSKD